MCPARVPPWLLRRMDAAIRGRGSYAMENYTFVEKIGRGTHGTAYLLRSRDGGGYVVCKSVAERHIGHAQREIAALERLSHRRIVRKLDSMRLNGSVFILLEYANHGTLAGMIEYFGRGGAAPGPGLGWSVLSQVSDALYYVHSRRIIHRDVKPANVLVNKFWVRGAEYLEFKLCDFSLAVSVERRGALVADGAAVGTPFYMAPEMVRRLPYGAAVDVWGMGVALYELLACRRPFSGDSRAALCREILEKEVCAEGLCADERLSVLVCRCLAKEGRPASREVARDERVRLHLTMLELRYRDARIEALEGRLRAYERGNAEV